MFPQVFSGRFCPPASEPPPFGHYTTFTIQGSELPGVLFALVFVGREWAFLFPHWFETVYSVKKQKYTATCLSRLHTFRFQFAVSPTSMSILLVRCLALQDFRTYSPWWIERLAGLKRSRSLPPPPPTAQRPSCTDGYSGLAFQASSQATEVHSSPLHFGPPFVPFSPSNTHKPQHTIPSQMAW
jgi:hypothetical protein